MPNYYEMLKIQPAAAPAEVEQAISEQYNQWRRLVTHHDPNIVNQANQALQVLEVIRTTLTNPEKRSIYDMGIGVGTTGGLADLDAVLRGAAGPVMAPPMIRQPAMAQPTAAAQPLAPGLWNCPKCHTENPPMSEHCFKCGAQLLRMCPECESMTSLITTGVCGKCGYPYDRAAQRRELLARVKSLTGEIQGQNESINQIKAEASKKGCGTQSLWLIAIFGSLIGIAMASDRYTSGTGILILLIAIAIGIALTVNSNGKGKVKNQKIAECQLYITQKQKEIELTKTEYDRLTVRKA